jgi:hypothetical protein
MWQTFFNACPKLRAAAPSEALSAECPIPQPLPSLALRTSLHGTAPSLYGRDYFKGAASTARPLVSLPGLPWASGGRSVPSSCCCGFFLRPALPSSRPTSLLPCVPAVVLLFILSSPRLFLRLGAQRGSPASQQGRAADDPCMAIQAKRRRANRCVLASGTLAGPLRDVRGGFACRHRPRKTFFLWYFRYFIRIHQRRRGGCTVPGRTLHCTWLRRPARR